MLKDRSGRKKARSVEDDCILGGTDCGRIGLEVRFTPIYLEGPVGRVVEDDAGRREGVRMPVAPLPEITVTS